MKAKKNIKIADVFSLGGNKVYLREDFINRLNEFLNSKTENILNIGGTPGTGKTFITLKTCRDYLYVNFYKHKNIKNLVMKTNLKLIIIDEFDKYHLHKKKESKMVLQYIIENNIKLITLGNDLVHSNNSYILKPYTSQEIEEIIKNKMKNELGKEIMKDYTLKIISKKHGSCGDMRLVFNYIISNYKGEEVHLKNEVLQQEKEENIHHKLVKDISEGKTNNKRIAFKVYLEKCNEIGIPPLHRLDFYTVYEIYN